MSEKSQEEARATITNSPLEKDSWLAIMQWFLAVANLWHGQLGSCFAGSSLSRESDLFLAIQIRESSLERSEGLREAIRSFSGNRPSLEEVRESAMEMDKISARKRQPLEHRGGSCQDSATEQGRQGMKGRQESLAAAEAEIASERDARHSKSPNVSPWIGIVK